MRRAGLVVAVAFATGCTPAWITSPEEQGLYKRVRVAPTLEGRLGAADGYLRAHPDGAYAAEIRKYFDKAEPVYYAAKENSVAGLEAYLQTLPKGPHAATAAARLGNLKAIRAREKEEDWVGQAARTERNLERAQAARRKVVDELVAWIDRFLVPARFDAPLESAPPELLTPWSLSLPEPACALDKAGSGYRCSKVVSLLFTVITNGEPEEREATLEIAIDFDLAGAPTRVTVGGPELFLRLAEARAKKPLAGDDAMQRVDAIASAVALVKERFDAKVSSAPSCARSVVAPTVLDLACGGLALRVVTGVEGKGEGSAESSDDRVEISRVAGKP